MSGTLALRTACIALVAASLSIATSGSSHADPAPGTPVAISDGTLEARTYVSSMETAADGRQFIVYGKAAPPAGHRTIVLASRAPDASAWSSRIIADGDVFDPTVAVDAAGNAVVVYSAFKPADALHSSRIQVRCQSVPIDPLDPGTAGILSSEFDNTFQPGVAVGGDTATIAFYDDDEDALMSGAGYALDADLTVLRGSVIGVCGTHSSQTIAKGAGNKSVEPDRLPAMSASPDGTATIGWTEREEVMNGLVKHARLARVGANAKGVVDLGAGTDAGVYDIASTSDGGVAALWGVENGLSVARLAAGSWEQQALGSSTSSFGGAITATPTNGFVAAASLDSDVSARRWEPGDVAWSSKVTVATGVFPFSGPGLSITPTGVLTIGYTATASTIGARSLPSGAPFSASSLTPAHTVASGGNFQLMGATAPTPRTSFLWLAGSSVPRLWSTDVTDIASPPPTASVSTLSTVQRSPKVPVFWTVSTPGATSKLEVRVAPISTGAFGTKKTVIAGTSAHSVTYQVPQGATACFSVTATDGNGTGPASAEKCTVVPYDDRSLSASTGSKAWAKHTGGGHVYATWRQTSAKSATLAASTVSGRYFGLIADTGPGYGSVKVTLNGTLLKTVSLSGPTQVAKLIPLKTFTSTKHGKVVITVTSSTGHVVRVDGIWAKSG